MLAIIFLLLGSLPPLALGPLAGMVFINILKRGKLWYQFPFWAFLLVLNLLVMLWIATSSGIWFPIASLSAFFLTPVAAILTVFGMRAAWRRLEASAGVNSVYRRWYSLALVLIPTLQMAAFVALLIFAPWLCKIGFMICRSL